MGGVKSTKNLIQYIFFTKVLYFNTPLSFGHQDDALDSIVFTDALKVNFTADTTLTI
jgi:hypothetical protein